MTLVGNNEDWYHTNFSISFYLPNSYRQYGYAAFTDSEVYTDVRAGMNDQGVFIDSAYVRPSNVTIYPEKPFIHRNFFRYVLDSCASVNETIELFSQYNIAETWDWQILVADSHGDSVVIVASPDETVQYIRRNETYQLITNGNIAYPELGESSSSALRYYMANNLLGDMNDNISVDNFRDVLDVAH
jgi:penicillin V acylase-like amidase (Ntn superfamily)